MSEIHRQSVLIFAGTWYARHGSITRAAMLGQCFGEALGAGPLPPSSALHTTILAERAAALLRLQV